MFTHQSSYRNDRKRSAFAGQALAVVMLLALGTQSAPLQAGYVSDITQSPLYLGGQVESNIVYIIDDSGSMNWSYIPDDISGDNGTKRAASAYYNTLFYDPNETYQPPRDHLGASLANSSFTAAKIDGYSSTSSTRDLSINFSPTWTGTPSTTGVPAYYYVYDSTNAACSQVATDDSCYDKINVSSTSGPGGTDERTNFANWYSYYRTRLMTAKAGSSLAFATLTSKPRIGYGRINQGSSTIDGVSTATVQRGVRAFAGTDRQDFFNWLFAMSTATYTPLRKALDGVGQYYKRIDAQGPYSTTPGVTGGDNLSCRPNFTVLMTDGYWNSNAASTADAKLNNDGTDGTIITGPDGQSYTYKAKSPFTDTYDSTLADVAMYYWKTDLTTLTNNVRPSSIDPAFWQHMVTFGVGLGVPTAVDPTAAFDAIKTGAAITWPDPVVTDTSTTNLPPGRADDLLHASVNSRGGFFNAQSPNAFATAMTNTLQNLTSRTSSAAAIATNSTRLDTNTYIYQAKYDSGDWSGRIYAYQIAADGSVAGQVSGWDGTGNLGSAASRNIFTHNGTNGVTFLWSNLSAAQQTALGSNNMLNYIRGDKSNEVQNGGTYRNRNYLLGDIIDSDPWFVGTANFGYNILPGTDGDTYVDFLASASYKARTPVIYVGANDGMLHAYDAETGTEMFDYVPSAVIPNLPLLADPNYTHHFYVNGSPRAGDVYIDVGAGAQWRTALVGATGAGGRNVYALDVTYPDTFGAGNVLWEFNYDATTTCATGVTACKDIGYTIGQPSIVRLASGQWGAIFGNGYNSDSQTAQLFIVDIQTGQLIRVLNTGVGGNTSTTPPTSPNGLATPVAADIDGDRVADYVYGGDLHGNLWKFDISDPDPTKWAIALKQGNTPKPLFTAVGTSSEVQPITAKPQVGRNPNGGYIIFFGTGKYFETNDNVVVQPNPPVMSFYGIYDQGNTTTIPRTDLLAQTITLEDNVSYTNGADTYTWDIRLVSNNPAVSGMKGWYLDLISPPPANLGKQGERVVTTPLLWEDRVIFTTLIPNNDPCSWGGDSWLMELDPVTGGRLGFSVFDLNQDGSFGTPDYYSNTPVSGKKSKEGIIKTPGVVCADAACYKYSSGSSGNIEVTSNKGTESTGRQSWEQLK